MVTKAQKAKGKAMGTSNKGKEKQQYVSEVQYSMFEGQYEETGKPKKKKGGRPTKNLSELGDKQRRRVRQSYDNYILKKLKEVLIAADKHFGERMRCVSTTIHYRAVFPKGHHGNSEKSNYTLQMDGNDVEIVKLSSNHGGGPDRSDLVVARAILYEATSGSMSSRSLQNVLSAADGKVKAYKVEQEKKRMNEELDKIVPIVQLKEGYDAYYMDPEKILQHILPSLYARGVVGRAVTVCLSGDGRNMNVLREKSSIIISIKIITSDPFSTDYVIPIVLAKGNECRENIEEVFQRIHASLRRVRQNGVKFGRAHLPVRLTFCADGKFLLMALGIHAAHGHFSCPYCVLKKDQWLLCADDKSYVNADDLRDPRKMRGRTGSGPCPSHTASSCASSDHGVKQSNLLENLVDLRDVFIDELHLFLRLWDCVEEYLIAYVEHWEIEK